MSDMRKGDIAKMPNSHGFRPGLVEIVEIIRGDAVVRYLDDRTAQRISLGLLVRDMDTHRANQQRRLDAASKIGKKTR